MKTGEVSGAFWAPVTHPCTLDEFLDQMYGDTHMLSHLAGVTARVDIRNSPCNVGVQKISGHNW